MKKIKQKSRIEIAEFFCDKHLNREAFSHIKTLSWYGSKFDMTEVEIHLCDECMSELYKYIKKNYKKEPNEITL